MAKPLPDLIRRRFGRLVVKESTKNEKGLSAWICECDCGKEHIVNHSNLTNGTTTSCGCSRQDNILKMPNKEELEDLYIRKKYGIAKIAKYYGEPYDRIGWWLKKRNITIRSHHEAMINRGKNCNLTEKQIRILDGMLLGDGHLTFRSCSTQISYTCKYLEIINLVRSEIPIGHNKIYKATKVLNNKICECFTTCSNNYRDLVSQRKRWYPEGVKIIPDDLFIHPSTLFWWYIGDGTNHQYSITLATNCFSYNDHLKLINLLKLVGIEANIRKSQKDKNGNQTFNLYIRAASKDKFLNYCLRENKIPDCYEYKFNKLHWRAKKI